MSATLQPQRATNTSCREHHIIDWDIELRDISLHDSCVVGRLCALAEERSCPKASLFAAYERSGLWDACDPKHRACHIDEPCLITGEKSCARILYVAKYEHANGTCFSRGSDHVFCPTTATSDLDRQYLFPKCSACLILTEARSLVLIHRRMLDECVEDEGLSSTDIDCIRTSLSGYIRAYNVRRKLHLEELEEGSQMKHDLEMDYACGNGEISSVQSHAAGRKGWWKSVVKRAMKAVIRILS
ncbi:hypothetical protein CABS01_07590 [Colletotrichum abscissum]|uniref:Uncharacterized protein n=1 Tax=Colletotrichum abscissum TaxID=1671311 RepID=A0A9Q0B989_9PEZI|nr:uncharacterized protein CABS01_07590 [Colletotrichum abscissum]KAI3558469.1 hypothetical protein CABS02_01084 [Colletotrichum abscissum]KAK1511632.1 hypothetical protein CABS01_07590 [Colletotrichum abscissum]